MLCSCTWWPAHDPDFTVEETGTKWRNDIDCANPNHEDNWQKLRFVYPKNGQGADAWDKSDTTDLNDIYVKDNWADNGTEPSSGNPWHSPDIFVRYNDEPVSNFSNANVDYHQGNPIAYKKNFLYARIRNRGHHSMDNVYVKFYAHGLSTNTNAWVFVGHAMIRDLAASSVQVVKSIKPWVPSKIGHGCIMVIIDSTQDPVTLLNTGTNFSGYDELKGPQPQDVDIRQDNNVAQRNMTAVLILELWAPIIILFEIRPFKIPFPEPDPLPRWYRLDIERPTLPREANISLNLPEDMTKKVSYPLRFKIMDFGEKIFQFFLPILKFFVPKFEALQNRILKRVLLKQDQDVDASLKIDLPSKTKLGEQYQIVIKQNLGKDVLGGITVLADFVAPQLVKFIGNVDSKEAHLSTCSVIKDLEDRKKRAFYSFNDARSWGYSVHKECAEGYDL
jgi:hypothetical protein